jgi:hypothetical protein
LSFSIYDHKNLAARLKSFYDDTKAYLPNLCTNSFDDNFDGKEDLDLFGLDGKNASFNPSLSGNDEYQAFRANFAEVSNIYINLSDSDNERSDEPHDGWEGNLKHSLQFRKGSENNHEFWSHTKIR